MNDKPISKGDLVMVVRPGDCCAEKSIIGSVHTVTGFYNHYRCGSCGRIFRNVPVAFIDGLFQVRPLHRLIRIDPDALKDDVPESEELHV